VVLAVQVATIVFFSVVTYFHRRAARRVSYQTHVDNIKNEVCVHPPLALWSGNSLGLDVLRIPL
jgi:hypothetical protein